MGNGSRGWGRDGRKCGGDCEGGETVIGWKKIN